MEKAEEVKGLPEFVSFGEALTDMIRVAPDQWKSVPGGAPWNVARVMACFGVSSAFGGAIGRDCFSDVLYRASEQAGLDLRMQLFELGLFIGIEGLGPLGAQHLTTVGAQFGQHRHPGMQLVLLELVD